MKDILDEIIAYKRVEVERMKELLPPQQLYRQVEQLLDTQSTASMRSALMKAEVGIIAEMKRRSPSKGWIKEEAKADEIPLSYQENGASAISILTDEHYFGGNDNFIRMAKKSGVNVPVLYKNFVIDEYQLFQARECGASAVLLIAAALSVTDCRSLIRISHELGMEVLLEMHAIEELDYADLEPDVYGVNNRNLGTFITSIDNSLRLISRLPKNGCKVSESGIEEASTAALLLNAGFNGLLIGENFMKTPHPGQALSELIDGVKNLKNILS